MESLVVTGRCSAARAIWLARKQCSTDETPLASGRRRPGAFRTTSRDRLNRTDDQRLFVCVPSSIPQHSERARTLTGVLACSAYRAHTPRERPVKARPANHPHEGASGAQRSTQPRADGNVHQPPVPPLTPRQPPTPGHYRKKCHETHRHQGHRRL